MVLYSFSRPNQANKKVRVYRHNSTSLRECLTCSHLLVLVKINILYYVASYRSQIQHRKYNIHNWTDKTLLKHHQNLPSASFGMFVRRDCSLLSPKPSAPRYPANSCSTVELSSMNIAKHCMSSTRKVIFRYAMQSNSLPRK